MTVETDSLIRFFQGSRLPGGASDVNTPYPTHAPRSFHYAQGTWAPRDSALDYSNGSIGLAVDFAFVPSQYDSPGLLAIWAIFARQADKLIELIHAGAPWWISGGRPLPRSTMPQVLADAHKNHVHVALRRGASITWPSGPAPAPPVPPPVVTTIGEVDMGTLIDIYVTIRLDERGCGYGDLPYPREQVRGQPCLNGSDPTTAGYPPLVGLSKLAVGQNITRIDAVNGRPHTDIGVWVERLIP